MLVRLVQVLGLFLVQANLAFAMGGGNPMPGLETVRDVDLNRYMGKWYEIVRMPLSFERDCVGVTAEYAVKPDGKVSVTNTCRKYVCDGKVSKAEGTARVVDPSLHSKLKVSFFWPFEGDYWILGLDSEYTYAVVGSPDRKSFWILSRTPELSESIIQEQLKKFEGLGFKFEKLIRTQSCG